MPDSSLFSLVTMATFGLLISACPESPVNPGPDAGSPGDMGVGVDSAVETDATRSDINTSDSSTDDAVLADANDINQVDANQSDARLLDARRPDGAEHEDVGTTDQGSTDAAPPCLTLQPPAPSCNDLATDVDQTALQNGINLEDLEVDWPLERVCDASQIEAIFNAEPSPLDLDCSLTFPRDATLNRNLIFSGAQASNLTIDCQGGSIVPSNSNQWTIQIRSLEQDGVWNRPSHIRLVDCHILGSVRILGLGRNAEAEEVRLSSHNLDHSAHAKQVAPTDILFERVQIEGTGTIPFYLAPGVTHVRLINSQLTGSSSSTAIYLDAESAFNVIQNNVFTTQTSLQREVIAVDGSAHNLIAGNAFSSLHRGGVYIYRNCGEGGTVRHQQPRFNKIINNFFYYDQSNGLLNPTIWLGSRNGLRSYCGDDDGYDFGSSLSNLDYADFNLVLNNQIRNLSADDQIWDNGDGNLIADNLSVTERSEHPSACSFFDSCHFRILENTACFSWKEALYQCQNGQFLAK